MYLSQYCIFITMFSNLILYRTTYLQFEIKAATAVMGKGVTFKISPFRTELVKDLTPGELSLYRPSPVTPLARMRRPTVIS